MKSPFVAPPVDLSDAAFAMAASSAGGVQELLATAADISKALQVLNGRFSSGDLGIAVGLMVRVMSELMGQGGNTEERLESFLPFVAAGWRIVERVEKEGGPPLIKAPKGPIDPSLN